MGGLEQAFADFLQWLQALPAGWIYAVLLAIAYGENVFPPIPGDLVIAFGGYLAAQGLVSAPAVAALATLGGAVGFMTVYAVGHRLGRSLVDQGRIPWLTAEQVARARAWVRRWGYGAVAANRFLAGARSVISLTVGMAHMDAWRTAAWATFSAAAWTTLIVWAGYAVGENWARIGRFLDTYGRIVLGVLVLAALVQGIRWYRGRNGKERAKEDAEPIDAPRRS